jgi:hypothetical protein
VAVAAAVRTSVCRRVGCLASTATGGGGGGAAFCLDVGSNQVGRGGQGKGGKGVKSSRAVESGTTKDGGAGVGGGKQHKRLKQEIAANTKS